jgi:sugar/nucleoside kinase (ribokinase family)
MPRAVTFGEIMLRLSPEGFYRFMQADRFEASFGGGEANVAVSLAGFGMDTAYVTKLPKHEIGQMAVNSLRRYGVDTHEIVRGGDRVGIYYLERGASQRGSLCIYDRAGSAIAEAKPEDFDWDRIFEGAEWFHITGITPALGANAAAISLEACKTAKKRGLRVSCDLNYRSKLWSREEARKTMSEICKYVDIPMQHVSDRILGLMNRRSSKEKLRELVKNLREKIPEIVIRTTFIVGFPGETKEEFSELVEFIKDLELDRVGFFKYSREEGTRAAGFGEQIDEGEKERRLRTVMEEQTKIMEARNRRLVVAR